MTTPAPPDLKTILVQKALGDAAFKGQLLADPKGAIERLLGVKLPEALEVAVAQEAPGKVVVVLPFQPGSGELSDQDLETVTGGWEWVAWTAYSVGTLGIACAIAASK